MAEYIEKQKAVDLLVELEKELQQLKPFNGFEHAMYRKLCEAKIAIEKLPAADVMQVLRCKDCVHWDDDPDTYGADDGPKGKCMKSFETMRADDFCSYGERKENNHEKV